jgi:uncharacterized protein
MILKARIQSFYHKFLSLKGDPASLAWGMAMGVFVGITPTIPLHTVMVIFFGFLFKMNLTSAYLGACLVSNPLTIPLLYVGEYEIGRFILGQEGVELIMKDYTLESFLQLGWEVAAPLLVGGFILALLFAVPAYFLSYRFLTSIRKNEPHEICPSDSP